MFYIYYWNAVFPNQTVIQKIYFFPFDNSEFSSILSKHIQFIWKLLFQIEFSKNYLLSFRTNVYVSIDGSFP